MSLVSTTASPGPWVWAIAATLTLGACASPVALSPAVAQGAGVQAQGAKGFTGDVRVIRDVTSRFLRQKRDVWVYLPPGYAASGAERAGKAADAQRYPVLYLHDGNNCFDGSQAFGGHEWQADESAERLIRSHELPPMILVGVGNSADRMGEYTWVKGTMSDGSIVGGDGSDYAKFLTSELKPLIDRSYRTRPGRADTGVLGSSLGGLESLYLARHDGEVFGKIGAMSPSIWWSHKAVLAEVPKMPTNLKIWLDMGWREGNTPDEELANARELRQKLEARGYKAGDNLGYFEDKEGGHDEQAWAYRLPMALKFLYGRP